MTAGSAPAATLLSAVPADDSTDVPTNATVEFTFSLGMDTNVTVAKFNDLDDPFTELPMTYTWSRNNTVLTCSPVPSFPSGKVIIWNLQGLTAAGGAFGGSLGNFTVAGSPATGGVLPVLLSRGELHQQVGTDLFEVVGQEFIALAGNPEFHDVRVTTPTGTRFALSGSGLTNLLSFSDAPEIPIAFATNYPAGDYHLLINGGSGVSSAAVALDDGLLPSALRVGNWQTPMFTVLGSPCFLQWSREPGGAAVDYQQVQVEKAGELVFATPLPGSPGALNAASNFVILPAKIFTAVGRATVRVTAFTFTGSNTDSVPALALRGTRHRATTFDLRIVDGDKPAPRLLSKTMSFLPVDLPVMYALATADGVRPLRFEHLSGSLPPGMALDAEGTLGGQATEAGTFDSTVRITDLVGQTTTESLRVVTAPFEIITPPRLVNAGVEPGPRVRFDVVAAPGTDLVITRSSNLAQWMTHLTTNAPVGRFTLSVPLEADAMFFRVAGANGLPTPNPLSVTPVLEPTTFASGEIGFLGGTLKLTNSAGYVISLVVPPGAMDTPEVVRMTEVKQVVGLPLSGGLRAVVDLQPEGLRFDIPARLDIAGSSVVDPATVLSFTAPGAGSLFALQPSFITNQTVSLFLHNLEIAGTGQATLRDAQDQVKRVPDDPMIAIRQNVEATRLACALGNCTGLASRNVSKSGLTPLGETDVPWDKANIANYVQIAKTQVIPALQKALGGDDATLDEALRTWLQWTRDLALLGFAETPLWGEGTADTAQLQACIRTAQGLASKAVWNGLIKACEQCKSQDAWRIYRVISLARTAALLGFEYDAAGKAWECSEKCLRFELKITSKIVSESEKGTFTTQTEAKAKLEPVSDEVDRLWSTLMAFVKGEGSWKITETQEADMGDCTVTTGYNSGQLNLPVVKFLFTKKRDVYLPGKGKITADVFSPDLKVYMTANVDKLPSEGRIATCPKDPPKDVADIFRYAFYVFHAEEVQMPQPGGVDELVIGRPAFVMKDFAQGGTTGVVFQKPYIKTEYLVDGPITEETLVELLHKPK